MSKFEVGYIDLEGGYRGATIGWFDSYAQAEADAQAQVAVDAKTIHRTSAYRRYTLGIFDGDGEMVSIWLFGKQWVRPFQVDGTAINVTPE